MIDGLFVSNMGAIVPIHKNIIQKTTTNLHIESIIKKNSDFQRFDDELILS